MTGGGGGGGYGCNRSRWTLLKPRSCFQADVVGNRDLGKRAANIDFINCFNSSQTIFPCDGGGGSVSTSWGLCSCLKWVSLLLWI